MRQVERSRANGGGGSPDPDDVAVPSESDQAPPRASLVLLALILVAAVANLNLAVANVALPSIGDAFDSSQTTLNMIAVGYSLGLAASVLYLGAVGDRLRAQADADARNGARDPGLAAHRVRPQRYRPRDRARVRRRSGRHGVPRPRSR